MAFDKSQYDQEYNKAHITRKFIPFNDTVQDDAIMLEWLASRGNVTQYIKGLIRDDMARNAADSLSIRLSEIIIKPQDG